MLHSPAAPTEFPVKSEDDASRSQRLFGRDGVLMAICGGPCVSRNAIEWAFNEGAVAL
jgi:hypothetical protein